MTLRGVYGHVGNFAGEGVETSGKLWHNNQKIKIVVYIQNMNLFFKIMNKKWI